MRKLLLALAVLCLGGSEAFPQDLSRALRRLLAARSVSGTQVGVVVQDLFSGRDLLVHNPDHPFIPASNMKILTAASALEFLDLTHAFSTRLRLRGIVKDGQLEGDLVLEGDGDPCFGRGNQKANPGIWARQVRAHGIHKITGNLVVFERVLDPQYVHPDWKSQNPASLTARGAAALGNGENVVVIRLRPGKVAGQKAMLSVDPPCGHVQVVNRTRTVGKKEKEASLWFQRPWGSNRIEVRARIRLGARSRSGAAAVHDAPRFLGRCMVLELKKAGVGLKGGIVRESGMKSPRGRILAEHDTPLDRMIRACLHQSDNRVTEILFKTAGAAFTAGRGTFESGTLAGSEVLKRAGAAADRAVVRDGSGLSRLNRLTPRQIVEVLCWVTRRPYNTRFTRVLPRGGEKGSTLKRRFTKGPLRDALRAKTGYLNGVRALSGFLRVESDKVWVFSLLVNGDPGKVRAALGAMDRFIEALWRAAKKRPRRADQ